MGLGVSAPVAAAHIIMIAVIFLTSVRLVRLQGRARPGAAGSWLFPGPIAMVFAAIAIERSYYVVARLLRPYGHDLWSMHPAPAMLSATVALSFYWMMPAIFRAQGMPRRTARIVIAVEVASFIVLGLALAAVLR